MSWTATWNDRVRRAFWNLSVPAKRLERDFLYRRAHGMSDPVLARFPIGRRFPGRAIDVGANIGVYTYAFSQCFDAVEAFEPQPSCAEIIERYARGAPNVRVRRLGLSDRHANATLHVPIVHGRFRAHRATGLASLAEVSGEVDTMSIDIVPLDDFAFEDVSLMKIDVEGHEGQVIAGAARTIAEWRPTLIVEIEQRHLKSGSIDDAFAQILELGYAGFFFRGSTLERIEEFSYERDQEPFLAAVESGHTPDSYANNFIFEPLDGRRPPLFPS